MPPIALLRYPDFVYAAWSAAQNRPLRQQMLPLSTAGGGRICCPSEEGIILRYNYRLLSNLIIYATVGTGLAPVRNLYQIQFVLPPHL